jgi:hypothetical protein
MVAECPSLSTRARGWLRFLHRKLHDIELDRFDARAQPFGPRAFAALCAVAPLRASERQLQSTRMRANYLMLQNPCASMPRATLNFER